MTDQTQADFDREWYHGLSAAGGVPADRMLARGQGRRWVWDFVHRRLPICVEVNGGQGAGARSGHGSWKGLERDAAKALGAAVASYWQATFTTSQVVGEDSIAQMERLLALQVRLQNAGDPAVRPLDPADGGAAQAPVAPDL